MKSRYRKIMREYAEAFIKALDWDDIEYELKLDGDNTMFVGDTIIVNLDDVRYVVDNQIDSKVFNEWYDYNYAALDLGFNQINLKSWCMGAPHLSPEAIAEIQHLRDEYLLKVDEAKSKY